MFLKTIYTITIFTSRNFGGMRTNLGLRRLVSSLQAVGCQTHRPNRLKAGHRTVKNKQARPRRGLACLGKIWRQPTLAEAIQPLPSARLCLTAVFGMGTGRTTAL